MSDEVTDVHKTHKEETIDWDPDYFQTVKDLHPSAAYGPVSESIRHSFPEKQVCSIGCGGEKCKYCNPTGPKAPWSDEDRVVKGLYCNWVTSNILATSRPTTKAIKEFNIIDQFQEKGIRSIINLQQPAEHESCGFGNEPDGFSYNSKDFMDADIFFYNFGWKDYGIGSMQNVLDMVKVTQFALSEGKIAIHCHAGLGRTGVLIACYLIYANRIPANQAIFYVRSKRKKSIQTSNQIQCIYEFEEYLKPLRIIFSPQSISCSADEDCKNTIPETERDFSLRQFMVRQNSYLHGEEARRLKHIPKIVYICCQRLLELAECGHRHEFHDKYKDIRATAPRAFNNASGPSTSSPGPANGTLNRSLRASGTLTRRVTALSVNKSTKNKLAKSAQWTNGYESDGLNSAREKMEELRQSSDKSHPVIVGMSLPYNDYTPEHIKAINNYKNLLNTDSTAYEKLYAETDAVVISGLMWSWLDSLREPALDAQDLPGMLQQETVLEGLAQVHKATRGVLETLFLTIAHLHPIADGRLHDDLYCRALSTLTHQNMFLDMDYLLASTGSSAASNLMLSRTSNSSGLMRGHLAERLITFFCTVTRQYIEKLEEGHRKRQDARQVASTNGTSGTRRHGSSDATDDKSGEGDLLEELPRITDTRSSSASDDGGSPLKSLKSLGVPAYALVEENV